MLALIFQPSLFIRFSSQVAKYKNKPLTKSVSANIYIHIRHPVFAIQIVFVTWCIRYSHRLMIILML